VRTLIVVVLEVFLVGLESGVLKVSGSGPPSYLAQCSGLADSSEARTCANFEPKSNHNNASNPIGPDFTPMITDSALVRLILWGPYQPSTPTGTERAIVSVLPKAFYFAVVGPDLTKRTTT